MQMQWNHINKGFLMENFSTVSILFVLLTIYTTLVATQCVVMKMHEDFLRKHGPETELLDFLKNKNWRHILTLGFL